MQRKKAKLGRSEAIALILIVAAAVFLVFGYKAYMQQRTEGRAEFEQQHSAEYAQYETIALNSTEDGMLVDEHGDKYFAGLSWDGTMKVSLGSVKLYSSAEEAGIGVDRASSTSAPEFDFLLCEVTIENVDAVSTDIRADKSKDSFNISFIRVLPWCEVVYFEGLTDGEGVFSGNDFILAPGETKSYRVGFAVMSEVPPEYIALGAVLAGENDYVDKYRIPLDLDSLSR